MFNISKYKNIKAKHTRYQKQLRRIQEYHTTECTEAAVEGSIKNIKAGIKSFIIYGEPQSGKTEMMICLTAKLLDEGHKIIILLLNDNVELLKQNYQRFHKSGLDPTPKKYDQILDPSVEIGDRAWIIFCKKNSRNLQDLIEKIGHKKEKIIIDDEADYATPDSNVNKKEKEATAVNKYVRTLLDKNAIYIGVTATPARLDLNATYDNDSSKWVHFPPHVAYTGQDSFFPLNLEEKKFYLKLLPEDGDLPVHLRSAIFSFMVNVAYLNIADDNDERNFSMLVHTSGKIDDHKKDLDNINGIIRALNNENLSKCEKYLEEIWKIANERYPNEVDEILEYILHNKGKISPIVMNNKSKDDYELATDPDTPFTIAIGGNIISRGMTFNRLLSMFFTRGAKHKIQQDTYIQRARMFGSRGDILKFFELYITEKLYEDWHRCFMFHRLSWEAIQNGEVPVWLSDKRISSVSPGSINKSVVSFDRGEISFELFKYNGKVENLWNNESLTPMDKLTQFREIYNHALPPYLLSFLRKTGMSINDIFIHPALDISKQKDTNVETIIRKKGLFGGSEIKDKPQYKHHFRIFYNNKGLGRLVYKHAGKITFMTTKPR